MNSEIHNNNQYINNQKTSKAIGVWTLFISIVLLIFIVFSLFYKFIEEKKLISYFDENLVIYVLKDDLSNLSKYKLKIDDEYLDYEIKKINGEIMIDNEVYYEVILNCNLKEEYKIKNNVLNIILEKEYITLFEKMKGELF